jgi:hypothetical protein
MKRFLFLLMSVLSMMETMAHAAPIGIPGATVGANKSQVGTEVNFLFDRNLDGAGEIESLQAFAKGEVGLNDRVDFLMRLGFGDFKADALNLDTDIGPAFGIGFKTTWAAIPDANLKIGSVAQITQIRAKDGDTRISFKDYDLALGAYFDASRGRAQRSGDIVFLPYGGFAFSGVDLEGNGVEEDVFGLFFGLAMRMGGNVHVGIELRLPEQTALGIQAGFAF